MNTFIVFMVAVLGVLIPPTIHADEVPVRCSLCNEGEVMNSINSIVPAGTISFVTEDQACIQVELAAQLSQWTTNQCAEMKASHAHIVCGCTIRSYPTPMTNCSTITDTLVNNITIEDSMPITAQFMISLESAQNRMQSDVEKLFNTFLTNFFRMFLTDNFGEKLTNLTVTMLNQTLANETGLGGRQSLDSWVEVKMFVQNCSELLLGSTMKDDLIYLVMINSDILLESFRLAGTTAAIQLFFSQVTSIRAKEGPESKGTPKPPVAMVNSKAVFVFFVFAVVIQVMGCIFITSIIIFGLGEYALEDDDEITAKSDNSTASTADEWELSS